LTVSVLRLENSWISQLVLTMVRLLCSGAMLMEETPRMVEKRVENWGMSGRKLKRNVN